MTVLIKNRPSKTRLSKISPRKTGGVEVKPREEEDPYRYFDGAGFKDDERDDDRD